MNQGLVLIIPKSVRPMNMTKELILDKERAAIFSEELLTHFQMLVK